MKTKPACEAPFKVQQLKRWKNQLSVEASFKFQPLKIWKRGFRAWPPSNSNGWRFENEAFAQGLFQIPTVEDVKTKLQNQISTPEEKFGILKHFSKDLLKENHHRHIRANLAAFARGLFQIPTLEDVKAKLSCEASFKFQPLKMWKRNCRAGSALRLKVQKLKICKVQNLKMWKGSFHARPPLKPNSWRCEKEAFGRSLL